MKNLCSALLAITLVTLSACGSAPPTQFAEFAKLGTALTDSTPPLLDAAFAEAVSADSIVLSQARTTLASPEERLDMLETSSTLLRDRLAIYADLTRHSRLLRSYFVTLGLLADTSGDSAIGNGAKGIVDQLSALHPKLENAMVGDFAVAEFVKAAAPVAVGAFRSVALQRELEARADAITKELDLQQAVLTAIAEQMRSDIGLRLQKQNRERIEMPFIETGDLPADWTERRVNSLKTPITLTAVDAAAAASENLRVSFIALSEGGAAGGSLSQLLQDVSTVVSLVETLKKSPQP
jgi:hypothetical protein